MSNERLTMPSSGAGIVRYFEETKSKIQFKPGLVIAVAVIVMVLEILLYIYGNTLLGLQ
jgi:preprotein translocase subunit Sec61beta